MPQPKQTSRRRTTIAVSAERLKKFHLALRVVDGKRAAIGKPQINQTLAVDILLSLVHADSIQHLLVHHGEVLDSPSAPCFNVTCNSSTTSSTESDSSPAALATRRDDSPARDC